MPACPPVNNHNQVCVKNVPELVPLYVCVCVCATRTRHKTNAVWGRGALYKTVQKH